MKKKFVWKSSDFAPENMTNYKRSITKIVGVDRFLRRDKICRVMWEGFVPDRTKVLSQVKQRVRNLEEQENL